MVENTIVTGSDDWTARVWSVSNGACETVLACHSGAVTNVEYCPADKGIVTGK
jgi:WD40 repeat protein